MVFYDYLRKLSDINYLPSIDEVRFENDKRIKDHDYRNSPNSHTRNNVWFEVITKELIASLSVYLGSYVKPNTPVKILEVGAWNGKLIHHLQKTLQELYENIFAVYAVDNNQFGMSPSSPIVERISDKDAIKKYRPNIIIAANLSWHPYTLLPRDFQEKMRNVQSWLSTHLDSDFQYLLKKEQEELDTLFAEKEKEPDLTYYWRQHSFVQEYLLIWSVISRWSLEQTFWLKAIRNSEDEIESFEEIPSPLFAKEWFIKTKLDIPSINREELSYPPYDFEEWAHGSKVYSFTRAK